MTTNSNKQNLAALPFWRRAANLIFRASKWSVQTVIWSVTLLVSIMLLVSAYSDMVSPTVWIVAAYMGLIFPFILVVALLWFVLLVVTRRWRQTWLLLIVFLLCSCAIWHFCPIHFSKPDAVTNTLVVDGHEGSTPVDTFRVLTFNTLLMGNANMNKAGEDLPAMDLVKRCGADVVCLQEYHIGTSKKGYSEERLHDMVRKEYPYSHYVLSYGSKKNDGIVVFSKWPFKVKDEIDLMGKVNYHAGYLVLDVRGREVVMVNCHLRTNEISKANRALYKEQTRHFQVDSLRRMGQGLMQLSPSFITRTEQVANINRYLVEHEKGGIGSRPLLICGDLNDTPNSFVYRSLRGDLADTWEEIGFGPGITYREAPFWFRIDHIFHSPHFRALDIKVMHEEKSSDHYPVMATFQLLPYEE